MMSALGKAIVMLLIAMIGASSVANCSRLMHGTAGKRPQ